MRGTTIGFVAVLVLAVGAIAGVVVAMDGGPAAVVVEDRTSANAFLGVHTREETELAEGGARVDFVVPDSPALAAGIRPGDVIVALGGRAVRGPAGLAKRVSELEPGSKTTVEVLREGSRETIAVELGEARSRVMRVPAPDGEGQLEFEWRGLSEEDQLRIDEEVGRALEELERRRGELEGRRDEIERFRFAPEILPFRGGPGGKPILGVRLVSITPELREHFGAKETGVLVGGVEPDSPAARAGIRVGDILLSIAGEPVDDPSDVVRQVIENRGEKIPVELLRDGKKMTVEAVLPAPETPENEGNWPRAHLLRLAPVHDLM